MPRSFKEKASTALYLAVKEHIRRKIQAGAWKVGDRIAIRFGQRTLTVEVLALAEDMGKADAAALYREIAPSPDKPS